MTETNPPSRNPYLEYLIGTYFHQDWDVDGPDAQAVLDVFAENPRERLLGARDGAAELLASALPEEELEAELVSAGLEYHPPGAGMTHREFLDLVVERLTFHLEERQRG